MTEVESLLASCIINEESEIPNRKQFTGADEKDVDEILRSTNPFNIKRCLKAKRSQTRSDKENESMKNLVDRIKLLNRAKLEQEEM